MVQKVTNNDELITAITAVLNEKDAVLIEECITGIELTVGVIGNDTPRALPPSQAICSSDILSIEEKFLPGAGENQTPAPLPQSGLRPFHTSGEQKRKAQGLRGPHSSSSGCPR